MSTKEKKSIGHKIGVSILFIILLANLFAIALLWACCATSQLVPTVHPNLALAGLLFPGFLLLVIVFIPIWLVLKKRWIAVPILGLLACWSYIMDYCPINLKHEVPEDALRLVTWNINFMGQWEANRDSVEKECIEFLRSIDADIICLQELTATDEDFLTFVEEKKEQGFVMDSYKNLVVLSRLPILKQEAIEYESENNGSACFYLQDPDGDTLLLVNNHLESNRLHNDTKEEYVGSLDNKDYDRLNETGHTIGSMVRASTVVRAPQTDSLVAFVKRNEGRNIIMCGDFNDTPISYTYQQVNKVLKNAFRESGQGIGLSYNKRGFWVRIDHVFVSQKLKTYQTHIDRSTDLSDHYPLVTWIDKQ